MITIRFRPQRRVKVFTWDESLYARWATGGSVWLAPDDADRDDHDHGGSDDCRKISADNAQFPLLSTAAENEPNPEGGLVRDLRKNILDPILIFCRESDHSTSSVTSSMLR